MVTKGPIHHARIEDLGYTCTHILEIGPPPGQCLYLVFPIQIYALLLPAENGKTNYNYSTIETIIGNNLLERD